MATLSINIADKFYADAIESYPGATNGEQLAKLKADVKQYLRDRVLHARLASLEAQQADVRAALLVAAETDLAG